jgi:HrpA-like RNA helicase
MEQTDGECFIVCTQPRRISAIGVGTRVAQERGENIDGPSSTVGYSVRGESRRTARTRLLFCTTGVLLRRMQQQDPLLDGSSCSGRPGTKITHVIVDEVHERSLDSDHLLTLLKDVLEQRPDLKVILMSATINAARFAQYFGGCAIEHIPGFTHPVVQHWLEDVLELTGHRMRGPHAAGKNAGMLDDDDFNRLGGPIESPGGGYSKATVESLRAAMGKEDQIDTLLVARLVLALADQLLTEQQFSAKKNSVTGSILVFLPGLFQIRQIHGILSTGRGKFRGNDLEDFEATAAMNCLFPLMLHSTVPPRDQQKVFQRPPRGLVKVVLSTNIAETSITIDDVVCVIDTLRVNETGFDAVNGIACLEEKFCSQAAHRQRAGRGGRVRAGECWSLVSKKRHDHLPKFEDPEIFRVPLDQLYLRIESALAHQPTLEPGSTKVKGKAKPKDTSARMVLMKFLDR